MDFILHCNSLSCRTELTEQAVVTTCSHCFCLPCAENSDISASDGNARFCPACREPLAAPDDVIVTNLKPTDDYKSSVLSGLNPAIIMECAGRGLAFYAYQSTQEIFYQMHMSKSLQQRHKALKHDHDTLSRLVGNQKVQFEDQMQAMRQEVGQLRRANAELNSQKQAMLREREISRSVIQKQKNKQLLTEVEHAAETNAEQAVQSENPSGSGGRGHYQTRSGSTGSGGRRAVNRGVTSYFGLPNKDSHHGLQSSRSAPTLPGTLSSHRQQLPVVSRHNVHGGSYAAPGYQTTSIDHVHASTPRRPPLAAIDPNTLGSMTGYGMSAGLKMGRTSVLPSRLEHVSGRSGLNTGYAVR